MACGMQARHKKTYKVLIKKPEGKRPFRKYRRTLE
jgi:hypothetical protein